MLENSSTLSTDLFQNTELNYSHEYKPKSFKIAKPSTVFKYILKSFKTHKQYIKIVMHFQNIVQNILKTTLNFKSIPISSKLCTLANKFHKLCKFAIFINNLIIWYVITFKNI